MTLLTNFVELFMESAPWLMLGLLVAGLMKGFIPSDLLARHLGQPGFMSTVKAALLGAPLPLCSCGVIPAAMGLRRNGASKAATTSFLISTPETGVDSISISYALLGPFMAVIRPIAAISSAITAGVLVGKDDEPATASAPVQAEHSCCASEKAKAAEAPAAAHDCCASKPAETCHTEQAPSPTSASSCCASEHTEQKTPSFMDRVKAGLSFTFIDLVRDITLWLLVGLGFAALIKTFVPNEFLLQWGDGFLAFVVMAVIGVPMYICATASTPIAAGLLFSGVSPGAVLVFMLVGPATNIATVGLVKRELGNRALAAYLGSVVGVGFLFGFLVNYLARAWNIDFMVQTEHAHELVDPAVGLAASVLLAGLMGYALVNKAIQATAHASHAS